MLKIFSPSAQRGGVRVVRDVMVPMRDGASLATDIYFPPSASDEDAARYPVILERTPYGKDIPSRSERGNDASEPLPREEVASYFALRGYVVIYQDCRGRYNSEGKFVKYTSDGDDGYDTCAWIVAQDWSNGRIGTKGLSYAAHTQGALGSAGAPGVVAMIMDSGGFSNAYQNGIRQGGAFELKQIIWALGQALESPAVRRDPRRYQALAQVDFASWFSRVNEWKPGFSPLSPAPEYEDYIFEQWRHGAFDDYWKRIGLYAEGRYQHFPRAATMHISSWYDPYSRSACANFNGLAERGPVSLILGPWTHGNRFLSYAGDVDFGPAARLEGALADTFLALRADWFDRHLKQAPAGQAGAPVRIFVMGGGSGLKNADGRREHGGRWREEAAWPLARTRFVPYYLTSIGALSSLPPCAAHAAMSYTYDPADPVPTHGGAVTSGEPLMAGGAFDQDRPPAGLLTARAWPRGDVLRFQTDPLHADLEVTGQVRATLWIASDCVDTDFTFKLIDVGPPNHDYPDGYAMNLTDGILRARYRDSWERPKMMIPNTVYKIEIESLPISNLFKRGHRIRVDISSSNFPKFDANPNTGMREGFPGPRQAANNTVYMDLMRPSRIVLPVIPAA